MRRKALDLLARAPEREPVAILTTALSAVARELDALVVHLHPTACARAPGWADLRALWLVLARIDERLVVDLGHAVAEPVVRTADSTPAAAGCGRCAAWSRRAPGSCPYRSRASTRVRARRAPSHTVASLPPAALPRPHPFGSPPDAG
jgi:hypothetical protein